jgi:hypothetical protein
MQSKSEGRTKKSANARLGHPGVRHDGMSMGFTDKPDEMEASGRDQRVAL